MFIRRNVVLFLKRKIFKLGWVENCSYCLTARCVIDGVYGGCVWKAAWHTLVACCMMYVSMSAQVQYGRVLCYACMHLDCETEAVCTFQHTIHVYTENVLIEYQHGWACIIVLKFYRILKSIQTRFVFNKAEYIYNRSEGQHVRRGCICVAESRNWSHPLPSLQQLLRKMKMILMRLSAFANSPRTLPYPLLQTSHCPLRQLPLAAKTRVVNYD